MRLPGRDKPVRLIKATTPEEMFPETWMSVGRHAKGEAIKQWEIDRPKRDAARLERELITVPNAVRRT